MDEIEKTINRLIKKHSKALIVEIKKAFEIEKNLTN